MAFYDHPSYNGFADAYASDVKRTAHFKKQFDKRGFDDTVTWALDYQLICWLYPRLKRYHKLAFKVIEDPQLQADIKYMLKSFKKVANDTHDDFNKRHRKQLAKSFKLLSEHHQAIWF